MKILEPGVEGLAPMLYGTLQSAIPAPVNRVALLCRAMQGWSPSLGAGVRLRPGLWR
jgi:hypothetical protein